MFETLQIFDGNDGVTLNILFCRLVSMVFTLPRNLEVLLGYGSSSLLASLGALLAAPKLSLRSPKFLGCLLKTAWVF
jgi:hypothetical protein